MKYSLFAGIGLSLLAFSATAYAFDVPINDGYVTDTASIFTPDQKQTLETELAAYKTQTSNEIAIVTLPTLSGSVASDVAVEIGRKWGVGTDKNNGILMLFAKEEHEIWIATGYGLEGAVPDVVAHGIADKDMVPQFRNGKYFEGFEAGIDSLKKHIGGEYTAARYAPKSNNAGAFAWLLFLFFIFFNWIVAALARTKSWWAGGIFGAVAGVVLTILYSWWISIPFLVLLGLLFDYIVSKNGGNGRGGRRGGGGFGGFGGFGGGSMGSGSGGFGGFGGGSFGGGGGGSKW